MTAVIFPYARFIASQSDPQGCSTAIKETQVTQYKLANERAALFFPDSSNTAIMFHLVTAKRGMIVMVTLKETVSKAGFFPFYSDKVSSCEVFGKGTDVKKTAMFGALLSYFINSYGDEWESCDKGLTELGFEGATKYPKNKDMWVFARCEEVNDERAFQCARLFRIADTNKNLDDVNFVVEQQNETTASYSCDMGTLCNAMPALLARQVSLFGFKVIGKAGEEVKEREVATAVASVNKEVFSTGVGQTITTSVSTPDTPFVVFLKTPKK